MTPPRCFRLVAGILFVLTAWPAAAWVPETRVKMVDEAVRFMPPSLRIALEGHRSELLRGMLGPMKTEDAPEHRSPALEGTLDQTVAAEAEELAGILAGQTTFPKIADRFGRLAHYILDAGFPPGVSPDGDGRYHHFGKFCESRRGRFPLVFYGHDDDMLAAGDYRGYALQVIERSLHNDRQLAEIYTRDAEHPHASNFDDRSVPFAVGSLAYSRSINDVVRVWLTVWEKAGGDVGRTPYK
jgi:hypothetical protein